MWPAPAPFPGVAGPPPLSRGRISAIAKTEAARPYAANVFAVACNFLALGCPTSAAADPARVWPPTAAQRAVAERSCIAQARLDPLGRVLFQAVANALRPG